MIKLSTIKKSKIEYEYYYVINRDLTYSVKFKLSELPLQELSNLIQGYICAVVEINNLLSYRKGILGKYFIENHHKNLLSKSDKDLERIKDRYIKYIKSLNNIGKKYHKCKDIITLFKYNSIDNLYNENLYNRHRSNNMYEDIKNKDIIGYAEFTKLDYLIFRDCNNDSNKNYYFNYETLADCNSKVISYII